MTHRISGSEYPLSKIFSSEFDFTIPTYQRPYAWTNDQASELFDDLHDFFQKQQSDDTYFLGSIVLIKEHMKPHAEVIDGQQRLTSLTMLIAALVERFVDDSLAKDFFNYICEAGRPSQNLQPKPRLSLRERDREFFSYHIQTRGKLVELLRKDTAQLETESQQYIQANMRLFLQRLNEKFKDDEPALLEFGMFLMTRCYLVAVTTPDEQSAFRVFSVLNNRGLDLLPTDIIKADVIGHVPQAYRDKYNEKWENIETEVTRTGLVELLGHLRMIYGKTKARASLLQEFAAIVRPEFTSTEALIDDLIEPYAEAFQIAKNANYKSALVEDAEAVNSMIRWLNRIDNVDWLPVAIRFLAQKKDSPAYVRWFFERLERLAAYMHICGHYVNERMERYAKVLTSLEVDHSDERRALAVELTVSEKQQFRRELNGRIYDLNARRRNYVILRLDAFYADGAATYNTNVLTIEHVLPQTVEKGSEWDQTWPDPTEREIWVHRIGNLVPLARRTNSSARNFKFKDKCEKYFAGVNGVSSYALTTQVLRTPEWLPATVQTRQQELMKKFDSAWDLA